MQLKNQSIYCKIICGDSKTVLPSLTEKAQLIVTSPPYADARKKHYDSIHPDQYADWFFNFHKPFWDILDDNGSFVLNIKDKIVNGSRHRFVWKTILKLEEAGWKSVDDYIWYKTNPMPGYWPNRLRDGWEYCFHLAKNTKPRIFQDNVKIPIGDWTGSRLSKLRGKDLKRHNSENESGFGRDLTYWLEKEKVLPSNVIKIPEFEYSTELICPDESYSPNIIDLPLVGKNYRHPAVFPVGLPDFFIRLFTEENDLVIDPFSGSGSTGIAAIKLNRNSILVDNDEEYCNTAYNRIKEEADKNGTKIIKEGF